MGQAPRPRAGPGTICSVLPPLNAKRGALSGECGPLLRFCSSFVSAAAAPAQGPPTTFCTQSQVRTQVRTARRHHPYSTAPRVHTLVDCCTKAPLLRVALGLTHLDRLLTLPLTGRRRPHPGAHERVYMHIAHCMPLDAASPPPRVLNRASAPHTAPKQHCGSGASLWLRTVAPVPQACAQLAKGGSSSTTSRDPSSSAAGGSKGLLAPCRRTRGAPWHPR